MNSKLRRTVNKEKTESRKAVLGLEDKELTIQQIEMRYEEVKVEWKQVVDNRKRIREAELLDKYLINIEGEDEKSQTK